LVKDESWKSTFLGIIPGDWGKIGPGWLAGPSKTAAQAAADEAGFTSSSGTFARVSNAKKELGDEKR
jgi:hypothetical protein